MQREKLVTILRDAETLLAEAGLMERQGPNDPAHDDDLARTCSPSDPDGCVLCEVRGALLALDTGSRLAGVSAPVSERFAAAVSEASDAFWETIAQAFPEAKKGDLPFNVERHLRQSIEAAVKLWMVFNVVPENPNIDPRALLDL